MRRLDDFTQQKFRQIGIQYFIQNFAQAKISCTNILASHFEILTRIQRKFKVNFRLCYIEYVPDLSMLPELITKFIVCFLLLAIHFVHII